MIQFINTGLDERIIKSWNPAHPKVYKPVEVKTEHGILWENRPVNADIPEPAKQHHTKQSEETKLHPLVANAQCSKKGLTENIELSTLISAEVFSEIDSEGNKLLFVEGEEMPLEQVSKLAYEAEEELKKYPPIIAYAPFKEGKRVLDEKLSDILGKPVFLYMKDYSKCFMVAENENIHAADNLDENIHAADNLDMEEMTKKVKQAEKESARRIQNNQQYFSKPLNPLIMKANYSAEEPVYDYSLSTVWGEAVFTELRKGKPVILIGDETYTPEEFSKTLQQIEYEHSPQYTEDQLKAGIHPLVVNAKFVAGTTEHQSTLSGLLGMAVFTLIKHGKKKFLIFPPDKYPDTVSPKQVSDLVYKAEQKAEKLKVTLQASSDKLNKQRQKELKQSFTLLDPATIKHFSWNAENFHYSSGHKYFTGCSDYRDEPNSDSLFSEWKNNCLDFQSSKSYERYSYKHDWKMNGYMRGKDYEYYPEIVEDIKNLEHTIDQFTLPDNIRVYRILADYNNNLDKFLSEVLTPAGESDDNRIVIQDKGFASTSVAWEAVQDWKNEYKRIKLVIDVPKGRGRGAYIAPMSIFEREFEFLLQHGTMFKVLNVDKSDPLMYELHLQVVNCRPDMPDTPPDPNAKSLRKSIRIRRAKSDNHFVAELSDFNIVKL